MYISNLFMGQSCDLASQQTFSALKQSKVQG